jgi:hypothetical protein
MKYGLPLLLSASSLLSCSKDEDVLARVAFQAICYQCDYEFAVGGSIIRSASVSAAPATNKLTAYDTLVAVGTEVRALATPTGLNPGVPNQTATMVMISVDGFQQDLSSFQPTDSNGLGRRVELVLTVPALNAFGEPK